MTLRYTILQARTGDDGRPEATYPTDPKGRGWTTKFSEAHTWATPTGAANAARHWGQHQVVAVPKGES